MTMMILQEDRKRTQGLQMMWEGAEEGDVDRFFTVVDNSRQHILDDFDKHLSRTIFTGAFDEHYSNPKGFCWDILCTDEPINDDPE